MSSLPDVLRSAGERPKEQVYPEGDPRARAQELKATIAQLEQMREFLLQSPVVSQGTLESVTRDLESARAREAELEASGLAEYEARSGVLSAAVREYVGRSLVERCSLSWDVFDRAAWDAWLEREAPGIASAVTCSPLSLAGAETALGITPGYVPDAQPVAPGSAPAAPVPSSPSDPRDLKIADGDHISSYTAEVCLERAGLVTVDDVAHFSERELSEAGLSMSVIAQLRGLLEDCGLSFAADQKEA